VSADVLARTDPATQADPPGGRNLSQSGPRPVRPVRIREPLLAAAAVLGGSTSLTALVRGAGWIPPLLEVVAVIWLIGVGGRLARAPVLLVPLLQLVGFAVALTSLFTVTGIGGVLPNTSVVAEARVLLTGAWRQILTTASPSPSTPQLSFLIALAVGGVAWLSDVLVSQFRSPAMTALPLLSLYSVPASISGALLPWFSFAAPAALYAVLLAVSGHRTRPAGCDGRVGLTLRVGAIAALATLLALLTSGTLPGIGTSGWLPPVKTKPATAVGLSPFASLRGNLTNTTPTPLFTVTGQLAADYLSTITLTTWTTNQGWSLGNLNPDISNIGGPLGPTRTTGTRVQVHPLNYRDRFLPILAGTSEINGLAPNWNYDAALQTVFRTEMISPNPYTLQVNHSPPTVAQLQQDTALVGTGLTDGAVPASVRDLARQITAAGTGTFDKASALQQWFTDPANGFRYSLDVPAGDSGDALVDFLAQKRGFCQQYATAMAIMLRTLHIPSRVVIGFTQGALQADGSYLITSRNAHAWVEVPL
jgi:transglutaminase-like putative cysteine protease